jgi:DNA-binding SARP family transcriptional activator
MTLLRIYLFGSVRILRDDTPAPIRLTRAVQALLAYLLLDRQRLHPRDSVTGVFWGDLPDDKARACLSTTLWRLRQVIEPKGVPRGTYILTTSSGDIGFNSNSDYWLDVAVFESWIGRLLSEPPGSLNEAEVRTLEQVFDLQGADLLEGIFDAWAVAERERLRNVYIHALVRMMHHHMAGHAFEAAIACGQRALAKDPFREDVHRALMKLYLAEGQRHLAVRQYETCRDALGSELGILPMPETQSLYEQLIASRRDSEPRRTTGWVSAGQGRLVGLLEDAVRRFDEARDELELVVALMAETAHSRGPEGTGEESARPGPDLPADSQICTVGDIAVRLR